MSKHKELEIVGACLEVFKILSGVSTYEKLPEAYPNVPFETKLDTINDYLEKKIQEYSRFAIFKKRPTLNDFQPIFYYVRLNNEKSLLSGLPVGPESIVYITMDTKQRQISTPKKGPRQDKTFTDITGECIDYLVSDPLFVNGKVFGCIEYVLTKEPNEMTEQHLSYITEILSPHIYSTLKLEELSTLVHNIKTVSYTHLTLPTN